MNARTAAASVFVGLGFIAILIGIALVYPPAALIAGGGAVLAFGLFGIEI